MSSGEHRLGARLALGLALSLTAASIPAAAQVPGEPVLVQAVNASVPTSCAEHDNVYVQLIGADVRHFAIAALQPPYIDEIRLDTTEPDWRDCPPATADTDFRFEPREVVLFEGRGLKVVGYAHERFWRQEESIVRVAGREERGLHLIQLWQEQDGRLQEVMALYPTDGYWRLRPLPGAHLDSSVYGTSLLIGPLEERGRPIVDLASVDFDPEVVAFRLRFRLGGEAVVSVAEVSQAAVRLEVSLAPAIGADRPFAAVRSMFVNPWRADVTMAAWRRTAQGALQREPIMAFDRAMVAELRLERPEISLHNTSAPDTVLSGFATAP